MVEAFDLGQRSSRSPQAYELASLPRQSHVKLLREERQRRRTAASVGHPGVPNYIVTHQRTQMIMPAREEEAKRILEHTRR